MGRTGSKRLWCGAAALPGNYARRYRHGALENLASVRPGGRTRARNGAGCDRPGPASGVRRTIAPGHRRRRCGAVIAAARLLEGRLAWRACRQLLSPVHGHCNAETFGPGASQAIRAAREGVACSPAHGSTGWRPGLDPRCGSAHCAFRVAPEIAPAPVDSRPRVRQFGRRLPPTSRPGGSPALNDKYDANTSADLPARPGL